MSDLDRRIADNLARVRGQIAEAARRSGRAAEAVRLVAVTKYASDDATRALVAAGGLDLGESRPQSLWQKAAALAGLPIRWHFIGHLQRNKVRRTLPLLSLIHSIDSPRLLGAVDEEASALGRTVDVLLEVNISGDAAKTGLAVDDVAPLVQTARDYPHVSIRGLMAMASLEGAAAAARRDFAALRMLRDRLNTDAPPGVALDELSMGMSDDFEIAIEEGATIVRVGSALFEGAET